MDVYAVVMGLVGGEDSSKTAREKKASILQTASSSHS